MARKTLDKWIDEAMSDREKPGGISAISLTHMVGSSKQEVHTVRIGSNAPTPRQIAEVMRDKAEAYAQDLTGSQLFMVLAFYGESPEHLAAHPIRINPTSVEDGGVSTEAPTEAGMRQQSMRWADTFLTQVFKRQAQLDDFSMRTLAAVQSQTIGLIKENIESFAIIKELLAEKSDRTHAHRMTEIKEQRQSDMVRKLTGYAPALINTVAGRDVFPVNTEDTALIEALADNIDADMLAMLPNMVPAELAGPLQARIQKHHEAKRAREEAANPAKLPAYRGTPEADIGGGTEDE